MPPPTCGCSILERQVPTRVTTDPQNDAAPLWSPDGDRIVFRSSRRGRAEIYTKRAVGTEPERPILDAGASMSPTQWSADGKWLVYSAAKDTNGFSLWAWPADGSGEPIQVARTRLNATHGRLSPDSKWLAYASDESGEWQVYVQPFPPKADGERQQVSSNGGSEPRWRRDGKELFYLSPGEKMMSVPVTTEPSFQASAARPLFDVLVPMFGNVYRTSYTVSADGQRFLVSTRVEATPTAHQRHRELAIAPSKAAMSLTGGSRLGPYQTLRVHAHPPGRTARCCVHTTLNPFRSDRHIIGGA